MSVSRLQTWIFLTLPQIGTTGLLWSWKTMAFRNVSGLSFCLLSSCWGNPPSLFRRTTSTRLRTRWKKVWRRPALPGAPGAPACPSDGKEIRSFPGKPPLNGGFRVENPMNNGWFGGFGDSWKPPNGKKSAHLLEKLTKHTKSLVLACFGHTAWEQTSTILKPKWRD